MGEIKYPGLPRLPIRLSAKAVIEQDGKVLLIRADRGETVSYGWPGGGQEWGETLEECLHREVWEETRAKVQIRSLLCVVEYLPKEESALKGWPQSVIFMFLCSLSEDCLLDLPEKPDQFQVGLEWMPIEELKNHWVGPWIDDQVMAWYRGEEIGFPIIVSREGE